MPTRPLKQKTIGLLGGCSNVATGEYYRFLNDAVNARLGGWEIAETLIAGMNFGNIEAFIRDNDWDGLGRYMQSKIDSLVAGGADVILCVSNTLHKPMEALMEGAPIPMIHIADPTGAAIKAQGLRKVALFGTRPVMEMDYLKARYQDRFGIETVAPSEAERTDIDRIIFDELVKGELREASKRRYLDIAARMRRDDGVEGLILGCTEIFLLIDQDDAPDFPMFNTSKLHCDAAVEFALSS
ncbi:Aspartate racemase [Rhodovulum sp. P5]|uniref:aspartate/glutamate racemase family protein n=1 Tax=Rhodovulum sp. P5 TaxID=1564506 RepID=UPI0009C34B9A|nr:amino acid racemase [Rhodovulum sp. P5]ARE40014.1 Aspartate racemase [Rhodovulum sp. P5]